jgi:hypothetical protein
MKNGVKNLSTTIILPDNQFPTKYYLIKVCRIGLYLYFCAGELAEWSIAAVLKTVECNSSGGSNPSLSANVYSKYTKRFKLMFKAFCVYSP